MEFKKFSEAVAKRFAEISVGQLYRSEVEKDLLWEWYLNSFPEGSNPKYRERTEHDCQSCKSFIRAIGGVVAIVDGKIQTVWDVNLEGPYQVVAEAMAALVRSCKISGIFLSPEPTAGVAKHVVQVPDSTELKTWHHFFVNLPRKFVLPGEQIGPKTSEMRATRDVFARGLKEITVGAMDVVSELIAQKSLYRGEEHGAAIFAFRGLKQEYDATPDDQKEAFVWSRATGTSPGIARLKNTAIGTLLTDLSEGKEIEDSVRAFEKMVAPANYKRPTALVTKAMVDRAKATIEELGLTSALERRYATIDDVSINELLFADRSVKKAKNVFDEVKESAVENVKNFDKIEAISIDDFLTKILPKAESIEILVENRHAPNFVSLVAPADPTAKPLFKWPNNFSWSYVGDVTDSIKERVKRAGGSVTGDFRASLSWSNHDDLDLHLVEPNGEEIYYAHRRSAHGGELDVDMNAGRGTTREPVENITYAKKDKMPKGNYKLYVNQFAKREAKDVGFEVEVEFLGAIRSFSYPKSINSSVNVVVAEFAVVKDELTIVKSLPESKVSRTIWNVQTETFRKVDAITASPNHWGDRPVGNKHWFFMLEGCANDGQARGFYNEFLSEELTEHRKVLEIVGSKMRTEKSDRQLSGLGFSSTQRNELLCRVTGAFSRVVKIQF